MYLSKIEVKNFRNYKKQKLKLCNTTNIFIGDNAQGKTNILESIYILALTKSHRLGFENNIIQNGYNSCSISGLLRDGDFLKELEIKVLDDKKKVLLNKKEVLIYSLFFVFF